MTPHLRASATLVAESTSMLPGTQSAEKDGTWRLNSGSEMIVEIEGLNNGKPCRLVLDLESCRPKNKKIHALFDHNKKLIIGYWDNFQTNSDGINADFHLMKTENDVEAAALPEVVKTGCMIRNGVPIQVSVGAAAGDNGSWDLVEGKVQCNGREYDGAGELPLIILRGGELDESSIVTFGADDQTGRLAASQKPVIKKKETLMSDLLKVLLGKTAEKHHGLVARCVAEGLDESATLIKVHAADDAAKDETIKAQAQQIEELTAKLNDYAQKGQEEQEKETADRLALAASKGSQKGIRFGGEAEGTKKVEAAQVTTMTQAIKVTAAKHTNLKGFALRRQARQDFPDAEEK